VSLEIFGPDNILLIDPLVSLQECSQFASVKTERNNAKAYANSKMTSV